MGNKAGIPLLDFQSAPPQKLLYRGQEFALVEAAQANLADLNYSMCSHLDQQYLCVLAVMT